MQWLNNGGNMLKHEPVEQCHLIMKQETIDRLNRLDKEIEKIIRMYPWGDPLWNQAHEVILALIKKKEQILDEAGC